MDRRIYDTVRLIWGVALLNLVVLAGLSVYIIWHVERTKSAAREGVRGWQEAVDKTRDRLNHVERRK